MMAMSSLVVVALALSSAAALPVPTNVNYLNYFTAEGNDTSKISASIDCLLDRGPCDENLEELKTHLPEIMTSGCAYCTPENQLRYALAVMALNSLYQEELQALQVKYMRKDQMLSYDLHYDGGAQEQESTSSVNLPVISFELLPQI